MPSTPFFKQMNSMDCGLTCLKMVAKYYGSDINIRQIRESAGFGKEGVSLLGLSEAAENVGFRTSGVQLTYMELTNKVNLPAILHWQQNHFVVIWPSSKRMKKKGTIRISDPARGILTLQNNDFLDKWNSGVNNEGMVVGTALLLEKTDKFVLHKEKKSYFSWLSILKRLSASKWQVIQVFLTLAISSFLQFCFPFLTQSLVDNGIGAADLDFISLIVIAQVMLMLTRTMVDFLRMRLLLWISSIIGIQLLSDFWTKVTKLPIAYFDSFQAGDTIQRVNDNKQLQSFLTGPTLNTLFSLVNLVVFSVMLYNYSVTLFLVFIVCSFLFIAWIRLFLQLRRNINYQTFQLASRENNATLQLVHGMQEIKLHGAENRKRGEWESIQRSIFKLGFKNLSYNQLQHAGSVLINQGKDMLMTYLVARLVINGDLTFGAMLAIQYILAQVGAPIDQLTGFIQSAQDANISLERLDEIHHLKSEEDDAKIYNNHLPTELNLIFDNVSFVYPGAGNAPVLRNLNLEIEAGKTTAVVGISGSGKTTLLKLILKFYDSYYGAIKTGNIDLAEISPVFWRKQCGAVLQDGFIFSDTIQNNITIGCESMDAKKLESACKTANILEFIQSLPNGFNTKLGSEGTSISQGQRQRILIAREIYKNPRILLFDEATNSLDANNERTIGNNLAEYFVGKTVVIVAHRLSTVKSADKIIVLHKGEIVESGTHEELRKLRGHYFELVKNQLELET